MADVTTVRATLCSLALACLLFQGLAQPARAALGGTADSVESDRITMKALTRPVPTGALRKQELQLPSGTVVTEYLGGNGAVYAVTWHGPTLPNLQLILGNYFANLKTAAQPTGGSASPGARGQPGHCHRVEWQDAGLRGPRLGARHAAVGRNGGGYSVKLRRPTLAPPDPTP